MVDIDIKRANPSSSIIRRLPSPRRCGAARALDDASAVALQCYFSGIATTTLRAPRRAILVVPVITLTSEERGLASKY